ncbi:MAG: hypothetical protein RJA13_1410, partial [Bacteroidota bacterium]
MKNVVLNMGSTSPLNEYSHFWKLVLNFNKLHSSKKIKLLKTNEI